MLSNFSCCFAAGTFSACGQPSIVGTLSKATRLSGKTMPWCHRKKYLRTVYAQ